MWPSFNQLRLVSGRAGAGLLGLALSLACSPASWAQLNADGTGSLVVQVNGLEAARITSTGNVGVGTATPAQKLSVSGTIHATSGGLKFPDATVQPTRGLTVIGYASRADTGSVTFNNTIPNDNTIPQNTEGNELLSVTVTVPSASSYLYFWVQGPNYTESSNHSNAFTMALFRDGAGADAIKSFAEEGDYASNQGRPNVLWRIPSPGAGSHTFRVRAGMDGGSMYINRNFHGSSMMAGNLNQMQIIVAEQ